MRPPLMCKETCRPCPVRDQCTRSKTGGRTLSLQPRELQEVLDHARLQQGDEHPASVSAWICRSSNCPLVDTRAYPTRSPVRTAGTGARRSAVSSSWSGCTRQIVQKRVFLKFLSTSSF
ncbi:transposase [Streptomyces sp. NPDC056112]|uniref:transposase n=1 Tax=Streptomyces sp. NPDC056112 TaxID=3345715 RepID=UPI0035D79473